MSKVIAYFVLGILILGLGFYLNNKRINAAFVDDMDWTLSVSGEQTAIAMMGFEDLVRDKLLEKYPDLVVDDIDVDYSLTPEGTLKSGLVSYFLQYKIEFQQSIFGIKVYRDTLRAAKTIKIPWKYKISRISGHIGVVEWDGPGDWREDVVDDSEGGWTGAKSWNDQKWDDAPTTRPSGR